MLHMSENSWKYGFKWMVLIASGSELYFTLLLFIKKNIVHDLCFSGHNGVNLWNVYLKVKKRNEMKKIIHL